MLQTGQLALSSNSVHPALKGFMNLEFISKTAKELGAFENDLFRDLPSCSDDE
jgi:hypothetical protein